jgi:PAS domain S-box-containing protein
VQPTITEDAIERLKHSEELFARAFLTNPLPMTITNGETQRFTAVNERFLELVGYWRAEVIGRTSAELDLWSNADLRDVIAKRLIESGAAVGVHGAVQRKDGTAVLVVAAFQLLKISDGSRSVLTVLVPQ